MEISKHIEQKYLHDMAVDQLVDEYNGLGYQVIREPLVGDYHADLVASKDGETIIFEVKTGQMNTELRQKLAAFSAYVKQQPSHRLRVVFAVPPQNKTIEVNNLEELLGSHLIWGETPEELLELSSNTQINYVTDVSIGHIAVLTTGQLEVSGAGVIDVSLQYGGSDGVEVSDAYPFEFSAIMTHKEGSWQIEELDPRVDTSSFFE